MSKVLSSIYAKLIIGGLCIFSILSAFTIGVEGIKQWHDYKAEIYSFEEHFEESTYLNNILIYSAFDVYDTAARLINNQNFDVSETLNDYFDSEQMTYHLKVDGKEYTNSDLLNQKFYYKLHISKKGEITEDKYPDKDSLYVALSRVEGHEVSIYVGLQDDYITTCETLWSEQKELVESTITNVVYWTFGALICFIYLIVVTGRDGKTSFVDPIYVELKLLMIGSVIVVCGMVAYALAEQYFYNDLSFEILKLFVNTTLITTCAVVLTLCLSIVRNIKDRTFLKRCLIAKLVIGMFKAKRVVSELSQTFINYISIAVIAGLFIYTALIGWFGYLGFWSMGWVILGAVLFTVVGFFVLVYMNDLHKIKQGINKINQGDINYQIGNVSYKDLRILKDQINHISDGLHSSVERTLKAERLKTELITNVSHDLKTPLTSIISYTKLLAGVEGLPEEAKDYVAIIDKKSQRLKTLTQDLFDISKVQSGNERIVMERLNVGTLLSQSLAELESELDQLTICSHIEEDLYILSDGRKMSRVIHNLLVNIIKYTMPQTRVFIEAYQKDDEVKIEMKNISNYPLDFDKEEIMQRFKRGDEARSEEGHGLGLAIVKSYVEATGGRFDIVLDGDLFKAIITYQKD